VSSFIFNLSGGESDSALISNGSLLGLRIQRSESFMRRLKRRVEGEVLESEVVTGKRGDSEKV
jgi:hypothetical protein